MSLRPNKRLTCTTILTKTSQIIRAARNILAPNLKVHAPAHTHHVSGRGMGTEKSGFVYYFLDAMGWSVSGHIDFRLSCIAFCKPKSRLILMLMKQMIVLFELVLYYLQSSIYLWTDFCRLDYTDFCRYWCC